MLAKVIKHDIHYGIAANKLRYMLVIISFGVMNLNFHSTVNRLKGGSLNGQSASALNAWIHNLEGMGIFEPRPGMPFAIPMDWFVLQCLLALLILSYPTQDLYGYGSQLLIRISRRSTWWLSKCVWNLFTVINFYLLGVVTTCLCALISNGVLLEYNLQISLSVSGVDLSSHSLWEILLLTLFLPFFTSLALSFVQMTLSIILSPIYGYFIIVCNALISAYCYSPLLIANYSMVLRHESIVPNGFDTCMALIVDCGVVLLSIFIGLIYFMHCDILKAKKRR